jgi:hypothetical protein
MTIRQQQTALFLLVLSGLISDAFSFGLFTRSASDRYSTQSLNPKNSQQDELRVVTDLFVDSFWRGKVGGGAKELTEEQSRTLHAQQYSEFRKRYGSVSQLLRMLVCRNKGEIIGCAGVQVDTVPTFAEEHQTSSRSGGLLGGLLGNSIPAKPTGRWDTKMKYAPLMSNLVVSRQYRRKGIAEILVKEVEKLCQEWGYEECFLYVEKRNSPAVKLYQKLGYQTLWQDDKAQTLLPTKRGKLENSPTVIICMKKELQARKGISFWPF